jgi:uncharacterized protein
VIRAVLDANALVSAFPASVGALAELIDRWRAGQFALVVSEPILAEVERAWTKPYWSARFAPARVALVMALLRERAEITPITVHVHGVATHPEDDVVLAAAVSAQAGYLVTGDKGLLGLRRHRSVLILAPRDFLAPHDFLDVLEEQERG